MAKVNFKPSIYDFYVADAKLLGINQQVANIFLNRPFKKISGKNFEELMIAASFEIYGEPLAIQYQFTEDEQEIKNTTNARSSVVHQVQTSESATPQETFKPVHSDIKSQYTFANFVQGDNNHWAKVAL